VVVSEEQRLKQSEIMRGRYDGENNPFYGKTHSQETKEKLRKSREGICGEMIWNYGGEKLVIKDGVIIDSFKTSEEVAKFIGCSHSNVRHVLSGKQKTAKGFQIKHSNIY
jgi:hypothetical protein